MDAKTFEGKVAIVTGAGQGIGFEICRQLARQGAAVILISSDLEEVLAMSTRVLVMRSGRLVGEFASPANRDRVMEVAAGVRHAGGRQ